MSDNNYSTDNQDNLFNILAEKFSPFWPLFVGLFIIGILGGIVVSSLATPKYSIDASIIINDEKKGVDDSKIMESIDVFTSKKIVENEVEVLHSKELINDVVHELNLYASIFESGSFGKDPTAYQSSPVHVRLQNPNDPRYYKESENFEFDYDANKNHVIFNSKRYPVNKWMKNPFGGDSISFVENPYYVAPFEKRDLYFTLTHPKTVAAGIYNNLFVGSSSKLSTVVRLNYVDQETERGKNIVNQLIASYKKQSKNVRDSLAFNTLAFVDDRIIQVSEQLRDVEKELERYRTTEGVVNISEQGSLYLSNVGNYDRRIGDIRLQLAVLKKVESYVRAKRKSTGIVPSTLGIDDPILSQLLERLYDSEIEYEELRKTTAENNPILVALRNKINQIRPSILENVNSQKGNLNASLGNLNASSGKYNTALQVLPEQERKLVEITRKKKSIAELFEFLAQKREETALSFAPTQGDARIVESAEASLKPISPKKPFILLVSVLGSMALGLFYVVRKELFSSKILSKAELERYSKTPVLGELAYVPEHGKNPLIKDHEDIFVMDQFRHLLSNIGLYKRHNKIKTLLITSNIAGEGKSYVSANLAQTIALSGKNVALVDMDLRTSRLSSMFGVQDKVGISDFLSKKVSFDELIPSIKEKELTIISAGKKSLNSSELLASEELIRLFDKLYGSFDFVIIDTPPISMVSDASIINDFCDISFLVARYDFTPKQNVKDVKKLLEVNNLKNCSLIFNSVKQRGTVAYSYGYGHGYGFESSDEKKKPSKFRIFKDFYKDLFNSFRKKLKFNSIKRTVN